MHAPVVLAPLAEGASCIGLASVGVVLASSISAGLGQWAIRIPPAGILNASVVSADLVPMEAVSVDSAEAVRLAFSILADLVALAIPIGTAECRVRDTFATSADFIEWAFPIRPASVWLFDADPIYADFPPKTVSVRSASIELFLALSVSALEISGAV